MTWTVTTLIENNIDRENRLCCEHGLSMLIEGNGIRLLMDTGDSGAFYDNAEKMGVCLDGLDAILLSHAHYDHAGGFLRLIREKGMPDNLYVGKGFFKKSYLTKKDGKLHYIGIRFDRRTLEDLGVGIHEITEDCISPLPGISFHRNFSQVHEWEALNDRFVWQEEEPAPCLGGRCMDSMLFRPDTFPEETAVTLESDRGLVLIAGCSHPGIMNMVSTISARTGKRICGIIGGTHLIDADRQRLTRTIDALRDLNLDFLAVSHCTGQENLPALKEAFGEKYVFNNTGNVITI